jgi:cell division septal protein FtsQ
MRAVGDRGHHVVLYAEMSLRRRHRSRLRQFWVVAVVALALAAGAGYEFVAWPGFHVRHVRVFGNHIVPTAEILARARIGRRSNIWLQSGGAMERRIEAIPYILSAQVHRRLPASVTIDVTERTPFANARSGFDVALVDVSLRVLEMDQRPALPTIDLGWGTNFVPGETINRSSARALRDALVALRASDVDVTQVSIADGEITALLQGGARVLLGDEASAAQSVPLVEPILTRFALLGRRVQILDLRSPTTPVVTESASVRVRVRSPRVKASPSSRP